MTRPVGSVAGLAVAFAALVAEGAAVAQVPGTPAPLEAPYPVEAVERAYDSYGAAEERLIVGLGRAGDSGHPGAGMPIPRQAPPSVTLVGTGGFVHLNLIGIERRCEFLCGPDEGEECHWVGVYSSPTGSLETVGPPLSAFPGRLDLGEFVGFGERSPVSVEGAPLNPGPAGLLWGGSLAEGTRLEIEAWMPGEAALELTVRPPLGDSTPVATDSCDAFEVEWLVTVHCEDIAVLAASGTPLLASWPDYNVPHVEVLNRFEYAGSRHYLVRIGAKAQDVVGVISAEPAGWRARFLPRDWALIC